MQKILLLAILSTAALFAAPPADLLATVATDNYITSADLRMRIDSMPAQYNEYYISPDGRRQILDQLIEAKLFAVEAKELGYADNPEVLQTLNNLKEEIMTRKYLQDEVDKINITDAEISAHYNANKAQYALVRASHILVNTEDEAKEILAQINNGGDFAALAKEKSTDTGSAVEGGDLDFFARGQMIQPFEEAAFALKAGEMTQAPVQTQFGWHIIKTTETKQQELNEVSQNVRTELLVQKQNSLVNSLLEKLKAKYPVKKEP